MLSGGHRLSIFMFSAVLALLPLLTVTPARAAAPANDAFYRTWARTDLPVAGIGLSRTWMWGPEGFTGLLYERYDNSPGTQRQVQYFDKSRMEITHPGAVDDGLWYVTNGLLVVELITGRLQVGDTAYEERQPAQVNVAGDPGSGPTYAILNPLRTVTPRAEGALIIERLSASGNVSSDASLSGRGVVATRYVSETGHTIAEPFWNFMNSTGTVYEHGQYVTSNLFINPFYATGYPITEAYWATVTVAGTPKDVLLQCFERRCLTYTPDNPGGWRVEAGNVGQHYYMWRYNALPPSPPPPGNTIPVEGPILYASSLGDWPSVNQPGGVGFPSDARDSYIIFAYPRDFVEVRGGILVGNASYSIDIRSDATSGDNAACLIIRASSVGAYQLCLAYVSGLLIGEFAFYANFHTGEFVELGYFEFSAPRSPSQWNRIKIIAQGPDFWFFDGSTLVGKATHHGSPSGDTGFAVFCYDTYDPCGAAFRNLVIRSISSP